MRRKIIGRIFLGLCFTIALAITSQAQVINPKPPKICATMEQDSILRAKFPERGTLDDFERALQLKIEEIQQLEKTGRTKAGVITLPIIVHVVHNNEPIGTGPNISKAQIQAQIDVLNEDFRRKAGTPGGSSNNPIAADIEIEFCLSPVDQNGNPMAEPGIHRYNGGRSDWSRDQIENQLKPSTIWNPNIFFNVWTVKFASIDASLIGYAQFPDQTGLSGIPSNSPASTDGVVVRYQSFGSVTKGDFPVMVAPYNRGRTMVHETGHWLGLRHIWGDGPCADDFVSDTPTASGPSSGCPIGRFSCSTTNMVENYMDYTDDVCMNIFTNGQKTRMQAAMQISPRRKSLAQADLCSPVVADVPTANFSTENQLCVLLGSEVTFTDLSSNFPTEWMWTFEGGDPGTSIERNPKVKYNDPGSFKVSLIAKNSIGQSEELMRENYIVVSQEGLCSNFSNFKPEYTSTVVNLSQFGNYTGYLTGHNSAKSMAFSEFFGNNCGYKYISGVAIRFGNVSATTEDATVTITVWNARGVQNGPGSVVERKVVLLKQILDDITNDRPTTITFDRETPLFSRAFHVGVEIKYNENYSLAVKSSANGEATDVTSWVQDANGKWELFTIAYGANIAMDIKPIVGANLSVQVSASKLLVYPGEEVTLSGKGASIFEWNSNDGVVQNFTGPQLKVNPTKTTTYTTTGSGVQLCNATASTTIYIRDNVVGVEDNFMESKVSVFPNPGNGSFTLEFENNYRGEVEIKLYNLVGQEAIKPLTKIKSENKFSATIEAPQIKSGMYLIKIGLGNNTSVKKWITR